jgi:hypothetical protein
LQYQYPFDVPLAFRRPVGPHQEYQPAMAKRFTNAKTRFCTAALKYFSHTSLWLAPLDFPATSGFNEDCQFPN